MKSIPISLDGIIFIYSRKCIFNGKGYLNGISSKFSFCGDPLVSFDITTLNLNIMRQNHCQNSHLLIKASNLLSCQIVLLSQWISLLSWWISFIRKCISFNKTMDRFIMSSSRFQSLDNFASAHQFLTSVQTGSREWRFD